VSRRGFTLVEVLVAIGVAGVVALLVGTGFGAVVRMERRAAEARQSSMHGVAVRRQIALWLRAAVVNGTADAWDFDGSNRISEAGEPDPVLRFTTAAPGPFETGTARLALRLDRDPDTPERGLVVVHPDSLGGPDEEERRSELVPGATALVIRYLHSVEGTRMWTNQWQSSSRLPDAIEIRVFGDSIPPLLRVPLFIVPRGGA
jgi:prepilin-type N-terminal cleavage/methylation domain-containing protein